ncbi:MAG: beta-N-acetylhexosaminidase [Anaerolineae bacterium]|nr:beta-N-acetylhexosaminidase [Anaerolineae bacterium]
MMTLEEKIGQLLLAGFDGLEPPDYILEWLAQGRIGGVILFARNVQSPAQVARLVWRCHQAARSPILVSIDQEGGEVARLRDGFTESPGAMALSAARDGVALAGQMSHILAQELRALGINWNYAPVVDLSHNMHNPAVGTRSPGSDKHRVAQIAAAQVRGLQSGGVAASPKHFPGLGDTPVDTHEALPALDTPLERLLEEDLEPYRAVIAAGAASIMVTHTLYTALDADHATTVSPVVVPRLLRGHLGYEGVVTTDCMEMNAITQHYPPDEAAVLAALASIDLILFSHTRAAQEAAYAGLLAAARSGRLPPALLEAALTRIARLKAQYAITTPPDLHQVRRPEHLAFALEAARAGVTLVKAAPGLFPLTAATAPAAVVIEFASYLDSGIFETGGLTGFAQQLKFRVPEVQTVALRAVNTDPAALEQALALAAAAPVTVLVTRSAHLIPEQLATARRILAAAQRTILLCLRNPYDVLVLPAAAAMLCTCGGSTPSLQAAVQALLGDFVPSGRLPVSLNTTPTTTTTMDETA